MEYAILFDCDGVIVDSEPAVAKICAEVLNGYGFPAQLEDFAAYIGTGEDIYIGSVVRKYGGVYEQCHKDDVYNTYIAKADTCLSAFEGGVEFIRALTMRDLAVAVVSSAYTVKLHANLRAVGLDDCNFDAIVSGTEVERRKPWPDMYLLAAERCAVAPARCLVIEDAPAGIEAARKAGMLTVGFTSSLSAEQLKEAGADFIATDFAEIRNYVEAFIGGRIDV